jgi:hypothetical protein
MSSIGAGSSNANHSETLVLILDCDVTVWGNSSSTFTNILNSVLFYLNAYLITNSNQVDYFTFEVLLFTYVLTQVLLTHR